MIRSDEQAPRGNSRSWEVVLADDKEDDRSSPALLTASPENKKARAEARAFSSLRSPR
jgi:hypothetical protein